MKLPRMKCALVPVMLVCVMAHHMAKGQVNDLAILSDEFDDAATLANFQRIHQVEGWGEGANKLQTLDINTSTSGRLVMIPHSSSWYQDYVGELTFKSVTGDFVITTQTIPRNRAETGAPGSEYSLSGIMVRRPTGLTSGATGWQTGQQNYVFLSHGAASNPGSYQFEVKTTQNSASALYVSNGAPAQAEIQVARLGSSFIMLRRDNGGVWQVHRRYSRPDFPAEVQAGLTVYTDWPGVQAVYPYGQELAHNSTFITGQNPDLRAEFEYLRFNRPQIPAALVGRDFSNPAQVTDAELLAFLGASAAHPAGMPFITHHPRGQTNAVGSPAVFVVGATGDEPMSFQWRRSGTNLAGATGRSYSINSVTTGDAGRYSVVVSNAVGSVTSASATLSVVPGFNSPNGSVDIHLGTMNYAITNATSVLDPEDGLYASNVVYTLSIPHRRGSEIPIVRGIVIGAPGRNGSIPAVSPSWHRWLWDRQFAWIGVGAHGTSVQNLTNIVGQFATLRSRPELINAPVCIHGISMGGGFTYDFAATYPERTIAFMPHHMYSPSVPQTAAFLAVPGLFTQGEFDGESVSTHQWKHYEDGRLQGALWSMWIDWEHNHLARYYFTELAQEFFDACIGMRYPPSANPLVGPVSLNALIETNGWLGEHIHGRIRTVMTPAVGGTGNPNFWRDFETDCAHIAPYATFDRNPKNEHSWLPNERLAAIWRSHVSTGFRTVVLQLDDLSGHVNYFPGTDIPEHVFNVGQTIEARVDVRGFPDAARVEFFEGATRAGEVTGAPFNFTYPLTAPGVRTFWAMVTGSDGQQRVSNHRTINVRSNVNGTNTAPGVSKLANQVFTATGATVTLPFTIADAETAATNLTVQFTARFSSGNAWISSSSITGTGADRSLTVTLNPASTNVYGGVLTVNDGNLVVNEYIDFEVREGSNPAYYGLDSGVGWAMTHAAGVWSAPRSLRLSDENTPLENLVVTAVSANQTVLPNSNIVVSGFGEHRALRYRTATTGNTTILVTASDGTTNAAMSFAVTSLVTVTNTVPTISDLADRSGEVAQSSGPYVFRISDLHLANSQLSVSATSDNQAVLPNSNIVLGSRGRDRTITLTPNAPGTAMITVVVSDGNLSASDTFQVSVEGDLPVAPQIITPPQNQTAFVGSNVTFTVSVTGSVPLSYQWLKNGTNISGAVGSSLILNSVLAADAGEYSVVVSNSAGSVTSVAATLTVAVPIPPPSISTHPQSQTVIVGNTVSFSVIADGPPPLAYQWYHNATNIPSANGSTLHLGAVTTNHAGSYTVTVSNPGGIAPSQAANLIVQSTNVLLTNLNLTPLPDLGANLYKGFSGGLYPNGSSIRPAAHDALGRQIATQQVRPRNSLGSVDESNGRIVLVSVGMSNTSMEFETGSLSGPSVAFRSRANQDPSKNSQLVIVNGAEPGQVGPNWTNAFAGPWTNIPVRLANASVTTNQVQVLWVKLAIASPSNLGGATAVGGGDFPVHAEALRTNLVDVIRAAQAMFPNLSMVYLSTRIRAYTVFPVTGLNPEPFAYESGFAVKWLIERQLSGQLNADPANGPVTTPWLSWGPYLWADGTAGRSDGFQWESSDLTDDFVHPLGSGARKVADQLLAFFKTDPTATPWFLRQNVIGQPPVCTPAASTTNGAPPLTVQFSANANDPDGTLANTWWTFDDGTFGTNATPVKTFHVPGLYTARVTVTDNSGNPVTRSVTINVGVPADDAPEIVQGPQSQVVNAGSSVTFSVMATGTEPIAYQWMRNGTNISGATAASLTLTNVSAANTGDYTVTISNTAGSATSAAATLTVIISPEITEPPQSQSVNAGSTVTFHVAATGTQSFAYQWLKNGTNISGATGASLTLNTVSGPDAGEYRVTVSNPAGSATSAGATLTVIIPPSISVPPQTQTVIAGASVTFEVIVIGTAPFTYQWLRSGTNISGATGASLTLNSVLAADAGDYSVVVSNTAGFATSVAATLTVNSPATSPNIISQPGDVTVNVGQPVSFAVAVTGATPLTYQWRRNGVNIAGAVNPIYQIASANASRAGNYDVLVSNSYGSVRSSNAVLTVIVPGPLPPLIGTNTPADISVGTHVVAPRPERFGVNLRDPSELNNFTGDPGFEPTNIRRQHRATGGGANYIVNDASVEGPTTSHYNTLQDGFFDGAQVRVYRPSTNGGPLQFIRGGVVTNYVTDGFRRLNALPVTVSEFTDTNAAPGVTYEYEVRAINSSEISSTNYYGLTAVNGTALPGTTVLAPAPVFTGSAYGLNPVPPVPVNVTTTSLPGAVRLDWSDVTAPAFAGYNIYRRSAPANERYRIWLNTNGPAVQAGDWYFLEMTRDNAPVQFMHDRIGSSRQNDAWRLLGGANWPYGLPGRVQRDSSTVAPENGGVTSLRIENPGSHEVSIRQARFSSPQFYADFYPHLVPGRTYRMEAWLKQTGVPSGRVRFFLSQHYSAVQTNLTVGSEWQKFGYLFTAPPMSTNGSIAEICLGFTGPGTVWVDNFVLFEDADGNPATYPAFALRPAVAQALADFNPGLIRIFTGVDTEYWGVSMDDWTRAEPETTLHWEANTGRRTPDDPYKLPTALRMTRDCGGEPWLVVGSFMTEQEWLDLLEYLAAPYDPAIDTPASKPYAFRRYSQGQQAPWTDVFPRWFIEYGNELWNQAFQWNFASGNVTGQFTEHFFTVAKSSPWFSAVADKINFVANGWLVSPDRNTGYGHMASLASPSSHFNDVAVYIGGWEAGITVGGGAVNDEGYQDYMLYAPTFIRYFMDAQAAARDANAAAGHPYRIAVYEGGPGYANPSPGQPYEPISETYGKSLAAAVATLDTYLYNSLLDMDPQAYFTFAPGYNWSTHSPVANGYHPHANWLALQMRNQFVTGVMVSTHLNSAPTMDTEPYYNSQGGIQVPAQNDVPLIASYAFRDGDKYSVFVLSRSISNATPVTLRVPFNSVSAATLHKLTGDPRTNNVTHRVISPTSEPVTDFSPNYEFMIPPGSIYLFVFEGANTLENEAPIPSVSFAVGQGDTTTVPAVAFNVVFDRPVTGFTSADVQLSGTAGANRATVAEIAPFNGTTYRVIVSGMTSAGTVLIHIPEGVATGLSGISSGAAIIVNNTVEFSFPPPQNLLLAYDDFNFALTNTVHSLQGMTSGAGWSTPWFVQNFNPTNGHDGFKLGTNTMMGYGELLTTGAYAIGGRLYEFATRDLDVSSFGAFAVYGAHPATIGQDGMTLWASFVLRKDFNDPGPVHVSFVDTNGIALYGQINVGAGFYGAPSTVSGTRYWTLAVRNASNTGTEYVRTSVPIVPGETVLMVLEMRFGAQDTVRLYVNPPLTGVPPQNPGASITTTGTADIEFRNVRFFAGRGDGSLDHSGINRGGLDELRFGDTFAVVTPSVTRAPQTIEFGPLADRVYGDGPFSVSATSLSELPVSISVVSGPATIADNTVTITGAGTVTLRASQGGDANFYPAPDLDVMFDVLKATPVVTWSSPADIVYGTALDETQLNATANVPGTFSYNPDVGAILPAGSAQLLSATFIPADAANYSEISGGVAINVLRASQSIQFAEPGARTYGDAPFNLSAIATSGLTVAFSIVSGPATLNGNQLAIDGAGTVIVRATQSGGPNHEPAEPVERSFGVARANPILTWTDPSDITYGVALSAAQLNATANVPGTISYDPVAGTILNAGTGQTLSAVFTPNDTANYSSANATVILNVRQADQVITFETAPEITFGISPFDVTATASSSLPVVITVVSGPATISGQQLTILGAGAVVLRASQDGNENYSAAPTVDRTISVAKADPIISWATPAPIIYGTPLSDVQLSASASVPGATVYDPPSGTILNAGSGRLITVVFTPTDAVNYNTATTTLSITVLKADQEITFGALLDREFAVTPFVVTASASSSLPVSFTVVGGPASVSGNTVTLTGTGTVTIQASQAGDDNYNSASAVTRAFTVTAEPPVITTHRGIL